MMNTLCSFTFQLDQSDRNSLGLFQAIQDGVFWDAISAQFRQSIVHAKARISFAQRKLAMVLM